MKVLVIDDDPGMTELLCLLLKPATSDVYIANTGKDGLALDASPFTRCGYFRFDDARNGWLRSLPIHSHQQQSTHFSSFRTGYAGYGFQSIRCRRR